MNIPSSSIPRLSLYYRALIRAKEASVISSQELAELTGSNAAQVRKDLAYFGQFGTPGRGYNVEVLKNELRSILGTDKKWDVLLVGVGNLGSALLAYKGFKDQGFNITCAFDNDKKKIGKRKEGIRIEDIKNLNRLVRAKRINMGIVAVSASNAQAVIDRLVSSGVKAILNFAPIRPHISEPVKILNIDLSIELEKLTYFLKRIDL